MSLIYSINFHFNSGYLFSKIVVLKEMQNTRMEIIDFKKIIIVSSNNLDVMINRNT